MIDYEKLIADNKGHHWLGEKPDPDNSFGFIYIIVNLKTSKSYIGKKQYWSIRMVRRKGKRREKVVKPNNWELYTGSSKDLNKDIEDTGKDNFLFIILANVDTRGGLHYGEAQLQYELDVLTSILPDGSRAYYNKNIAAVKFLPKEHLSKSHRAKIAASHKGKPGTRLGVSLSKDIKDKMRESALANNTRPPTISDSTIYVVQDKEGMVHKGDRKFLVGELGMNGPGIAELIRGKRKTHRGYSYIGVDGDIDERYLNRYKRGLK